jgi:hypothetical protein
MAGRAGFMASRAFSTPFSGSIRLPSRPDSVLTSLLIGGGWRNDRFLIINAPLKKDANFRLIPDFL